MADEVLGAIRITPPEVRPGQPVLVEALGPAGNPLDPAVPVTINGVLGARQFLQFADAGSFRVDAVAGEIGALERTSGDVAVRSAAWSDGTTGGDARWRYPVLTAEPVDRSSPYHLQISAVDTAEHSANIRRSFRDDPEAVADATTVTRYVWRMADAEPRSTDGPVVDHDFGRHLAVDQEHALMDVSCTLETVGGDQYEVRRTLSVVNAYAVCRARGVVAPTVVDQQPARKVLRGFESSISVENREEHELTLTARQLSWEVGDDEVVAQIETLPEPVVLQPGRITTVRVAVPFSLVPETARFVGLVYRGNDPEGRKVHVETRFVVRYSDWLSEALRVGDQVIPWQQFEKFSADPGKFLEAYRERMQWATDDRPPDWIDAAAMLDGSARIKETILDVSATVEGLSTAQLAAERHARLADVFDSSVGAPIVTSMSTVAVEELAAADTVGPVTATGTSVTSSHGIDIVGAQQHGIEELATHHGIEELATHHGIEELATHHGIEELATHHGIEEIASGAGITAALPLGEASPDAAVGVLFTEGVAGPPVAGDPCDPDNPGSVPEGWACQVHRLPDGSLEKVLWNHHARYANARKGDLVLAPGGPSGLIGGLLGQVNPPQKYAHMGIMTRNFDMITHSTFSEDRLNAYPNGSIEIPGLDPEPAPTDGFRPDVLKYGWPGVITQWVCSAVERPGLVADPNRMPAPGEPETEVEAKDPESGTPFAISPFNAWPSRSLVDGVWQIVPPLVVKPDPLEETPQTRAVLHQIADAALAETGKSHYRFYCYTDGALGLDDRAPADAGWAAGTYPSVCSTFVWTLLTRAGVVMEAVGGTARPGDLEPIDLVSGLEVGDESRDGLYLYRKDEREHAAVWMHEALRRKVAADVKDRVSEAVAKADVDLTDELAGLVGGLLETFTDIGDDVANQMVNAFASDDTSTAAKDSDAWEDVGPARTVSPDNVLGWDGPALGGLYGYAVPADFRPKFAEMVEKTVWTFVPTSGELRGTVRDVNGPAPGASIWLQDGMEGHSDRHGRYSISSVPFGEYRLTATRDGSLAGKTAVVTIDQEVTVLDIELRPPRSSYRRIQITGSMDFMDYVVVGTNPRQTVTFEFSPIYLQDGQLSGTATLHREFEGIHGVVSMLFTLPPSADRVTWDVVWAVSDDSSVIGAVADALSSAVETGTFGLIGSLFGHDVNGSDRRSGDLLRGATVDDTMIIGPGDRSHGRLRFHLENLDA